MADPSGRNMITWRRNDGIFYSEVRVCDTQLVCQTLRRTIGPGQSFLLIPRKGPGQLGPVTPAAPEPMLYSGDERDPHEAEGTHSAAPPAPAAASSEGEKRSSPHQAGPQAKAARTASDSNTGKGSASQSPRRKARDPFRGPLDALSDDDEEEGAAPEHHEISNDLDGQHERYHAAQFQSSNLPSAQASVPVQSTQTAGGKAYHRGYCPPDEGTGAASFLEKLQDPRGLVGGYTSRDAFERKLVMNEPLFQENIEAARSRNGAYAKITTPHRVAKKPQTTYEAVDARGSRSRQPSGRLPGPGPGPPAPTGSVTWSIRATSQGAGASQECAAPGEHASHGSGGLRSGLKEPKEASYDYEPPTTAGGSRSPLRAVDPAVALQQKETHLFRDRRCAIEIPLGPGPGGSPSASPQPPSCVS
ncbi:unnamed protein product [Phytophthora fragariaefolia]|uniref:Unnamed protein product n=1 Tax=Phytophthora fragariaefolia TaxID=1490495 RepID=A0A9W6XLV4_9STRA|nr:unnamed protein product [Phytophthora fragariaefolia]